MSASSEEFRILKTRTEPGKYFCQSSEFPKATRQLSSVQRLKKCFSAIAVGNITTWGMGKLILVWMWWKAHNRLIGQHLRGIHDKTPTEVLGLQPGEMV